MIKCQIYIKYVTMRTVTEANTINKSKAIPMQAWTGSEVSRRLTITDFKTLDTLSW